ncbi:hypothetical protein CONCODRAFT_2658 [Conidiobolus coronatus NRRL 28638]|uniref:G-protein coupled receptors family 1 profile domain-containing protein n=1 Tax=Conidiobolus coronatus (strain ATCC 28846 / CBS 209.66 / NRRL 28638) TaxID=796925 RepID=A0A137PH21_CONC2|nr:hypothetical protein CONCODRAFT_2658 [Conidiobolus coronatus NRRL 28638]|eukprot:KXN74282.1 hypothetical protein CONCODRAFT_2658 [Conidiobolus coronatus NRRL 28638]
MAFSDNFETYNNIWPSPWVLPLYFFVISIVALFLGFTISYTILRHFRKSMHIDIQLGLFLTFLDTLSGFDFIINGIANLPPLNLYSKYYNWCISAQITGSTTFVSSMLVIGVIALERCLLIVYNIKLKNWYYWLMIACCCSVPFLIAMLVIFTNSVALVPAGIFCHFDAGTYYGVVAYILMFSFSSLAITVLIFSYVKIIIFRYRYSQREQLELGLEPDKVKKETQKTAIKLLSVLIINIGSNFPYCIAQIVGLFDPKLYSPKVAFFVVPWIALNIIWNSIIFLVIQEQIYDKWLVVIGIKSE